MDGIAFMSASTTTLIPWNRLRARNGRNARIVRNTRNTDKELVVAFDVVLGVPFEWGTSE